MGVSCRRVGGRITQTVVGKCSYQESLWMVLARKNFLEARKTANTDSFSGCLDGKKSPAVFTGGLIRRRCSDGVDRQLIPLFVPAVFRHLHRRSFYRRLTGGPFTDGLPAVTAGGECQITADTRRYIAGVIPAVVADGSTGGLDRRSFIGLPSGAVGNCRYYTGGLTKLPAAIKNRQCYSAWYASCPGLKVLTPYSSEDARGLLKAAIRDPDPVVFLENELLYGESFPVAADVLDPNFCLPIGKAKIEREGKHVTITSFSKMVGYALQMSNSQTCIMSDAGIDEIGSMID
ncbi:Pyruvate dehydrogenase E1 component subunit beta-1, mitochondrial [Dendrobium catenatum]|uniref:Pyruvate dehydrogenase E1 component subunit beta n=1 Tax=Dendrobium catenatum TaxID=906689 RepID=A0A2I0VSF8_9ASPA|nr:Pyruvate dehydrogenase E1 component subunit beta-1, mitochondrial [Dendrobium catenatum]